MPEPGRIKISPAEMRRRLRRHRGNMSAVAGELGVDRSSVLRFIDRHPSVAAYRERLLEDIRKGQEETYGGIVSAAEAKLWELINEGNVEAIRFALRCQGKDRGWIERQAQELAQAAQVSVLVIGGVEEPPRLTGEVIDALPQRKDPSTTGEGSEGSGGGEVNPQTSGLDQ